MQNFFKYNHKDCISCRVFKSALFRLLIRFKLFIKLYLHVLDFEINHILLLTLFCTRFVAKNQDFFLTLLILKLFLATNHVDPNCYYRGLPWLSSLPKMWFFHHVVLVSRALCPESSAMVMGQFPIFKLKWETLHDYLLSLRCTTALNPK